MKEIRVFKDGDSWTFVLPDFKNLQVSPAEIAHPNSEMNKRMDLIYHNLELSQKVCDAKEAIDALHQECRKVV
ncbi:MAG: hypothetical protein WC428_06545 [Candidatus Paceibacterota bacterium]